MSITLRPDQQEDIILVRGALGRTQRVLLCRPCGTGKTIIVCGITQAVAASVATLILQHRSELINQTARTLEEMGVRYSIIAAGHPNITAPVQIASIDTMTRRLDHYQPDDFGLIFVDEVHHAAAPRWQRVIGHFADAILIGCTASPLRLDGRALDHLFEELVVGRSVNEYVELGVLTPAVTFAPARSPDLSDIRIRAGDYAQDALAARMSNTTIIGDAVEHYKKLARQLPGLIYCCSIEHSLRVCEAFAAAGFAVRHVDGETPTAEREEIIDDLRAGRLDLVSNVGLFTEGLDVPLLGCVLILRPTQSLALHLQMIGRASRKAPGKRRGVILDHAGNTHRHGLYDFAHQWSLEGRPKKSTEPLARQCPMCGVLLPTTVRACSECGYEFVVTLRPALIPQNLEGQLERVDADAFNAERLRDMPYRELLHWCADNESRLELARRARGYAKGCKFHTANAWRQLQARSQLN